jgi:hypothetical protein
MTVLSLAAAREAAERPGEHPHWCAQHSEDGCLGEPMTVPGSGVRVWLWAPTAGDARLVVDGPGGCAELPVVA